MDDVPDITVELHSRRSVVGEATLAGGLAGGALLVAGMAGVASLTAIGYPYAFPRSPALLLVAFHLLFAFVFGTVFGLLVNTPGFWQYGRGFLGPLVGAVFGVGLWVAVHLLVWRVGLSQFGLSVGTVPIAASVTSYLFFGVLVGAGMNLICLYRA